MPDPKIMESAVQALITEDIIIHPTETVYGIAGLFNRMKAIHKILEVKNRNYSQPFSIMVDDISQILDISGIITTEWLEKVLQRLLPGPITVILPRSKSTGIAYWDQFAELGFRLPNHKLSRTLVKMTGSPIISTSANFSGEPPANAVESLSKNLMRRVSVILDGGTTVEKIPSTVVFLRLDSRKIELLRQGSISLQDIQAKVNDLIQ